MERTNFLVYFNVKLEWLMNGRGLFLVFLILVATSNKAFAYDVIPLWGDNDMHENKVIHFRKEKNKENRAVYDVVDPRVIYVPPTSKSNGTALIIIPGGGFSYIMMDREGIDVANQLSKKGYSSFVLIYRMPKHGSKDDRNRTFSDVQRSIRIVRDLSLKNKMPFKSVGVMGFSAGAYLAANISNNSNADFYKKRDAIDSLSSKPDFSALIYPVISMKNGVTHSGSRYALFGKNLNKKEMEMFSQEDLVSKETSPTFLAQSLDDNVSSYRNSILMFNALIKNEVKVEIHLFQNGGHGFSTGERNPTSVRNWIELFTDWQQALKKD